VIHEDEDARPRPRTDRAVRQRARARIVFALVGARIVVVRILVTDPVAAHGRADDVLEVGQMDVVVFARLEEVAHGEGSEIDLAGEPGHGVLLCRPRGVAGLGSGLRERRDVMGV